MYNSNVSIEFLGDGKTREFNFIFNIFNEEYLDVYVNKELKINGYKVLSLNIIDGGGIVVFDYAPNLNDKITIIRNLPIKRTTDFKEGGPFRASRVNGEFDYQIGCLEQLEEKISRSILKPIYLNDNIDLSLPEPSVGKAIIWDSTGNKLKNSVLNIDDLTFDIKTISDLADKSIKSAEIAEKASKEVSNKANNDLSNVTSIPQRLLVTTLPSGTDFNNIKTAGEFVVLPTNINSPVYGSVKWYLTVTKQDEYTYIQTVFGASAGGNKFPNTFRRRFTAEAWEPWFCITKRTWESPWLDRAQTVRIITHNQNVNPEKTRYYGYAKITTAGTSGYAVGDILPISFVSNLNYTVGDLGCGLVVTENTIKGLFRSQWRAFPSLTGALDFTVDYQFKIIMEE